MTALRRLATDDRGAYVVEFALILPVLLVLLMGLGELAFQSYAQAVLNGAMQKAGRDSTIQGNGTDAQTAALDAAVQNVVSRVVGSSATYKSTRTNFDNYAAIAGEPFTDSKYPNTSAGVYDGICDHGEPYIDVNNNGKYDLDLSSSGQGGASDITNYTMQVTYNRLFPARLIGWSSQVTLTSTTLLKNQPYQTQNVNSGTTTRTCS